MPSTVLKRGIIIAALVLLSGGASAASAARAETAVPVVVQLYKDFAWQAIAGTQNIFGNSLAQQNKATLDLYFDPALTALLLKDGRCVVRSRAVCNLDFDPIFASQDSGAADLTIELLESGKVAVGFNYPSSHENIKLEFNLALIAGKWKITDIHYGNWKGVSLKEILSKKVP